MQSVDFDTLLFPVNWAGWLKEGFGKAVLEEAEEQKLGCIAVKALADQLKTQENDDYPKCWYKPIYNDPELADMALRFTLSQYVHTTISPGDVRMMQLGLSIIEKYQGSPPPLSDEEKDILTNRAQAVILPVFC
jgi:hypothetical protein